MKNKLDTKIITKLKTKNGREFKVIQKFGSGYWGYPDATDEEWITISSLYEIWEINIQSESPIFKEIDLYAIFNKCEEIIRENEEKNEKRK